MRRKIPSSRTKSMVSRYWIWGRHSHSLASRIRVHVRSPTSEPIEHSMALPLMRSTREADVRSGARLRLDALAQCHCKVPWDAKSVLILLFCFTTILMPFLNAYPRSVMIYPLTHDPFVTTILAKICTISVNVELYNIHIQTLSEISAIIIQVRIYALHWTFPSACSLASTKITFDSPSRISKYYSGFRII